LFVLFISEESEKQNKTLRVACGFGGRLRGDWLAGRAPAL